MYLDYYGFSEEPFNITPNSRFLFLSERHREALGSLLYGIEQRKGFIALTGHIGCGKTTICRALLGQLDREAVRLALILNPELDDVELLQSINSEFGIPAESDSKRILLDSLNQFLLAEYRDNRNVVLLIDEAQRLKPQALEQVRLLSNLETEDAKLIQIALVGQPELGDLLDLPELEQLNQRITVRYHIDPLNFEETCEYIAHRISVADPKKVAVRFQKKALRRVYEYSNGVPRRINVICDRALLVTFVQSDKEVSEARVNKAIEELGGMPKRHERKSRAGEKLVQEFLATDTPPPPQEPERTTRSGISPWPLAVALLLGLSVVAFAIYQAADPGRGSTSMAATTTPPIPGPVSTPTPAPSPTPTPAPTPTATPTSSPSITPTATPEATPTPTETATPTATATTTPEPTETPTPSPSATPSPSPSPTETATPTPTASPSPTETATPTPEPTATPSASPSPSPSPEPETSALMGLLDRQEPTPTPRPEMRWQYDTDGVMRVNAPELTYPAAVLTWVNLTRSEKLLEADLRNLRSYTPEEVAALELTSGRPPLYLREARLPAILSMLDRQLLPAVVQTDSSSPGFGPYSVLMEFDDDRAVLHDPQGGRIDLPLDLLEDHLTMIHMLFSDTDQLVGLRPGDRGPRVDALQERLRDAGVYLAVRNSGVFDPLTEQAVTRLRENFNLPPGAAVDETFVFRLLQESQP